MKMDDPVTLSTPLSGGDVLGLVTGDRILLSGKIYTARDAVHKHLYENEVDAELKALLNGAALYHCGPIVRDNKVISAGPTTSIREEPYEADLLEKYGISAIIGKGGMGMKTLDALKICKAVYLSATGGAGALLADCIKSIDSVRFRGFGDPEAMWCFVVEEFPMIVTMDCHGNSIYEKILSASGAAHASLLNNL